MKYQELDDQGKEKARQWLAGLTFTDSSDWDHVYADAERVANLLGIEFDRRTYETVGGSSRQQPAIYFSGFSSQGDGASYEGRYKYRAGTAKAVKEYAPLDTELHRIAEGLQAVQQRHFYQLSATVKHRGHYYHSGCMSVEVESLDDRVTNPEAEATVTQLLRDFADWIYKQLEAEHDYQTSDEQLEESILANDYDFHLTGIRL